jgi:hypothetical protein
MERPEIINSPSIGLKTTLGVDLVSSIFKDFILRGLNEILQILIFYNTI